MWTTLWLFNIGNVASIILILWIALRSPYLSKRDMFFSVTVRSEFPESTQGIEIYRKYRRTLLLFSGLALIIIAVGNWQFLTSKNRDAAFFVTLVVPSIFAVGMQVAALVVAHQRARKQVLPDAAEPSSIREVSLVSESSPRGRRALTLFRLGPWLILALSALYLQTNWERIPDRFPIHWGATGQVNGWAHRSFYGVFGTLLMGGAALLLLEVILFLTTIGMPRAMAAKGSRSKEMLWMVQATRWLMAFIGYFIAGVFGVLSCWVPLHARSGSMPPFMAIFLILGDLLLLLGIGLFIAWMMNRKDKIRAAEKLVKSEEAQSEITPVGDRTEDKYWRLGGTIYYNPDDPAIWVEKRMGMGWTTNMARRESWYIVGTVFALIGLFMVAVFWIGERIQ